jgi:hypothetical protein
VSGVNPAAQPARLSLRPLALPPEHGGWGFLLEPVLLGLVLAPSAAGAGIAVAATGAFLARHPLKLALADVLRRRSCPRTRAAALLAASYAALAGASLALAASRSSTPSFWLPLALAAPLALVQLGYDARNRGRELAPQLLGAVAPGAAAACVLLAAGQAPVPAFALWLVLGARSAASVLYVRSRLRLDRGVEPGAAAALGGHALATLLVVVLAAAGLTPWLAVAAFALLAARAAHGLSRWRPALRPQALGFRELGYGVLTVVLLAIGYRS